MVAEAALPVVVVLPVVAIGRGRARGRGLARGRGPGRRRRARGGPGRCRGAEPGVGGVRSLDGLMGLVDRRLVAADALRPAWRGRARLELDVPQTERGQGRDEQRNQRSGQACHLIPLFGSLGPAFEPSATRTDKRAFVARNAGGRARAAAPASTGRRRAGQRIGAAGRLRERDHVADLLAPGEQRDDPVDAHRDPAVRRRAVAQRVEQEAEPRLGLLRADPEQLEHALLDLEPVDTDRAAADLGAVEHEVVGARESGSPGRRGRPTAR